MGTSLSVSLFSQNVFAFVSAWIDVQREKSRLRYRLPTRLPRISGDSMHRALHRLPSSMAGVQPHRSDSSVSSGPLRVL